MMPCDDLGFPWGDSRFQTTLRLWRDLAAVVPYPASVKTKGTWMNSFKGASGRRWSYDANKRLGPGGGFGEVFLATDGRYEFAVKRIPLRIGNRRERRRRERELEIAQKLTTGGTPFHHLLVPIDWGTLDDDLLLVMQKAEYSLAEAIPSRNFSPQNRYRAIRDAALGLSELSSAGILHRDLKPGNVLWLQGAWRLSDFGISRDIDASTATYTFSGAGTLPYMAPEVWELRPTTTKTDLYALGILAYEVLTGSRPFNGPKPEDYERQHTQEIPPTLQIDDGRMNRIITRLLSKDPAHRPQDAQTVVEVIDSSMRRLDSAREQVAASAAALAGALSQREAETSKRTRNVELGKQAFRELGAFLEDFADDMRDVFPGTTFTEESGYCPYYRLHLDAADIFFFPIEELYGYGITSSVGETIKACSVQAAVPSGTQDRPSVFRGNPEFSSMVCSANLMCDLVGNRPEWTIGTFKYDDLLFPFPRGYHQPGVVELRAESELHSKSGLGGMTYRSQPLTTDTMMWLVRHTFESLSRKDDQ
jgi:serine/threonine protein kinase